MTARCKSASRGDSKKITMDVRVGIGVKDQDMRATEDREQDRLSREYRESVGNARL